MGVVAGCGAKGNDERSTQASIEQGVCQPESACQRAFVAHLYYAWLAPCKALCSVRCIVGCRGGACSVLHGAPYVGGAEGTHLGANAAARCVFRKVFVASQPALEGWDPCAFIELCVWRAVGLGCGLALPLSSSHAVCWLVGGCASSCGCVGMAVDTIERALYM